MKPSDLKAGTTYVGKNGRRRHVHVIHGGDVFYDIPEGVRGWGHKACLRSVFARWAEREATPEEAAPQTEQGDG